MMNAKDESLGKIQDPKGLAVKLATMEKEDDVVALLQKLNYWDDYSYWKPFGDNDNNFSIIGNQQSKPDAALVEKVINSVDAILMKECMKRNIDPESNNAPRDMAAALKLFFNISEGQLSSLDKKTRNQLSEDIILAVTGSVTHMNIAIIDKGEGQTPARMPETLLSVSRNNKLRIPFVQGKFNMGGTGVLPFCGEHKLQLIISKRCPDLPNVNNDRTFSDWGFTIVRRESARENRRSSMYTYLVNQDGSIPVIDAENLPIIPLENKKNLKNKYDDMLYGTYIKLYNYAIPGYKSTAILDLNYRLAMLMPDLAHPVRIRECRPREKGHSFATTLSGLQTRLNEDRADNIENGFPSSETFNVDGQNIRCSVYVFKEGRAGNFREKDGVLFTVNGQTHAAISQTIFNNVNLSYMSNDILVLVDCSDVDIQHREDMFMNSRDRLRDCSFVREIRDRIKDFLRGHSGIKRIQNERRASAVQEKIADDKPLRDVLQDILNKSPVLSKILISGTRLMNPFDIRKSAGEGVEFKGQLHPTFFTIKAKIVNGVANKTVPVNHDFRITFETDVVNDYFVRSAEKGTLIIRIDDKPHPELLRHLSLFEGTATLTLKLPDQKKVGDEYNFVISIEDNCISQNFENRLHVKVSEETEYNSGTTGRKTPPKEPKLKGNRQTPGEMSIPKVEEKHKDDWEQFEMNENSALAVYTTEQGSDYFLNMDNRYLLTELKSMRDKNRISLTKARYKYSMALIGMSIESYYKNNPSTLENDVDVQSEIRKITTMLAPILVPMLESMAELDLDAM